MVKSVMTCFYTEKYVTTVSEQPHLYVHYKRLQLYGLLSFPLEEKETNSANAENNRHNAAIATL